MINYGIYGYYDKSEKYMCYIGKDKYININKRHKAHMYPSNYNAQKINQALQNNPNRYKYVIIAMNIFNEEELNKLEIEFIKLFKTNKYLYPDKKVFNFTIGGEKQYKDTYTIISSTTHNGFRILSRETNNAIKFCKDKEKLIPLVKGLNSGILSEDDVKKTNLNPFKYTISKSGKSGFCIRSKDWKKYIKTCKDKEKLQCICDALNNGDITEEEAHKINLRKNGYSVTKAASNGFCIKHNGYPIKYSRNKEKLLFVCDALNSKKITSNEVNEIYGVDNVIKKIKKKVV